MIPNDKDACLDRPRSLYLTGDGLCVEICPPLFDMHDDGLAYVKEVAWKDLYNGSSTKDPIYKMASGLAAIPDNLLNDAIEAADECPGECIFIQIDE